MGPQNFGEVFVMRTFDPTCFLVLLFMCYELNSNNLIFIFIGKAILLKENSQHYKKFSTKTSG